MNIRYPIYEGVYRILTEDTQKQIDTEIGKRRPGYLQGVCLVPLLPGKGHSKHRKKTERGV